MFYYVNIFLNLLNDFVNCNIFMVVKSCLISFSFFLFSLVSQGATPYPSLYFYDLQQSDQFSDRINIIYQNNTLLINGVQVNGNLKIYSIIGNMIMEMNVQDFSKLVIPINLERQNLYIIRIETSDNRIFTQKIVAH